MGLEKWIEQQLNPGSIDAKAMEARLTNYPTLTMSAARLQEMYPQPKQAEKQAARREQGELKKSDEAASTMANEMKGGKAGPQKSDAATTGGNSQAPSDANAPAPMKDEPSGSNPFTRGVSRRDALSGPDPNSVPRAIADDSRRPQRVIEELAMAKVTRAIYSQRQLQQVMDDFWFNHFNVFAGKGEDRYYLTSYERDVIQPHAFGKFKDLVTATAKSPAMLFYLDNFLSADPRAAERQAAERAARQLRRGGFGRPWPPRAPQQQQAKKNVRGLNENYGRELMELHTLGVDGGYK